MLWCDISTFSVKHKVNPIEIKAADISKIYSSDKGEIEGVMNVESGIRNNEL